MVGRQIEPDEIQDRGFWGLELARKILEKDWYGDVRVQKEHTQKKTGDTHQ